MYVHWAFFTDLFEFRVASDDNNGMRFAAFQKLIDEACADIRSRFV